MIVSIEGVREAPVAVLFSNRDLINSELERRAWKYLDSLGYVAYTQSSMDVTLIKRNGISLVQIKLQHLHLDVPIKQFEALTS